MNKGPSIALLVVGVVLLIFGFNAYNSAGSELSEAFTGAPTDKTVWLLVGGLLATIIGGLSLLRKG